jgi:hypothetical protein
VAQLQGFSFDFFILLSPHPILHFCYDGIRTLL